MPGGAGGGPILGSQLVLSEGLFLGDSIASGFRLNVSFVIRFIRQFVVVLSGRLGIGLGGFSVICLCSRSS